MIIDKHIERENKLRSEERQRDERQRSRERKREWESERKRVREKERGKERHREKGKKNIMILGRQTTNSHTEKYISVNIQSFPNNS